MGDGLRVPSSKAVFGVARRGQQEHGKRVQGCDKVAAYPFRARIVGTPRWSAWLRQGFDGRRERCRTRQTRAELPFSRWTTWSLASRIRQRVLPAITTTRPTHARRIRGRPTCDPWSAASFDAIGRACAMPHEPWLAASVASSLSPSLRAVQWQQWMFRDCDRLSHRPAV